MTDRYVLLVDAGYLIASAGAVLHDRTNRRELTVDPAGLVTALREQASQRMAGELLRTYWYDAARDRVPTTEHRALAVLPGVKVRLGNLNRQGQQKGVDALLRTDLELLARNRTLVRAVLLAGDEDMLPAVEVAQSYGVQVELWSVEPPYGRNHSERLVWEADTYHELGRDLLAPHVGLVASRPPGVAVTGSPELAVNAPPRTSAENPASQVPAAGDPSAVAAAEVVSRAGAAPGPPSPAMLAGTRRPTPPAAVGPDLATVSDIGEHIAGRWLVQRGRDDLADLMPGPGLPTVLDRELLVAAEEELGRSLRPWQEARRTLRDGFFERLWREFGVRA